MERRLGFGHHVIFYDEFGVQISKIYDYQPILNVYTLKKTIISKKA